MLSPETLRKYDFFSGLDHNQIVTLSKLGEEEIFQEGHYFFHEDDPLSTFYIVIDGAVGIVIEVPDDSIEQPVSGQLTGEMQTRDITITTVGTGMMFGWPGIIPPNNANATAKALTDCRVYSFGGDGLHKAMDADCDLAYKMTLKAAQVIRDRLNDLQIETLAFLSS